MRNWGRKLALLFLAGMAVIGLAALPSTIGTGSSQAQHGSMQNCPQPGKWSIAVWNGPPDAPIDEALGTCVSAVVEAAYSIDPETQVWSGYFLGRPEMSTLTALDSMQAVLALGGRARSMILQLGNRLPKTQLQTKESSELADNRIGAYVHAFWQSQDLPGFLEADPSMGLKRMRLAINELDWNMVDWSKPELSVAPKHDDFITSLADSGITITYVLSFWDKAKHPGGVGLGIPRFKTEEEIERYLEYVRFIVRHFKDRVQNYEIWNEPNSAGNIQWIEVGDYINLVKRTVPVIRQEYPEAKIVVGGVAGMHDPGPIGRGYLYEILRSDVMPLVDVVAWHPMYGVSPECQHDGYDEYYYQYRAIVQEIKDIASAHGFRGEYEGDEMSWWTPQIAKPDIPCAYNDTLSAKYYARAIVMHLGMDLTAGLGGLGGAGELAPDTIRALCTVMAGATASSLPAQVESTATNIKSYAFSLPNGDRLIALWTDGVAVDDDPGAKATVIFNGFSDKHVIGIDVLNGFEQQLIANVEAGNLVVRNLLVKDYPIILRLAHAAPS